MAKPLKYPVKRMLSLSEETDQKLVKRAKKNKKAPSAMARIIVEKELEKR